MPVRATSILHPGNHLVREIIIQNERKKVSKMEVTWYNIGEFGTKEDKFHVRNNLVNSSTKSVCSKR